jgi:hypothetical protein
MSHISPTAEGFKAAFRRPSLAFAEITWRWVVGATAFALTIFALLQYLDTLPVTNGELLMLRSRQPSLLGAVIAHILRGSLHRVTLTFLVASLALCGLWVVAASVGRVLTVRELVTYFGDRRSAGIVLAASLENGAGESIAGEDTANKDLPAALSAPPMRALARINFLRVALELAAICGVIGAAILAGFASPDADPHPELTFFLFLALAALVGWVCWVLNWFLSLAGLFAARGRDNAMGAISAAMDFCRERAGSVFAVSLWTGIAHLAAFVVATTVASMFLGLTAIVSWRLAALGIIAVALGYFVVADWLFVARMAGYVSILELPDALAVPLPSTASPSGPAPPGRNTIDFEEPILSDLPGLA